MIIEITFWIFIIIIGGGILYELVFRWERKEEIKPVISKEKKQFFGIYE